MWLFSSQFFDEQNHVYRTVVSSIVYKHWGNLFETFQNFDKLIFYYLLIIRKNSTILPHRTRTEVGFKKYREFNIIITYLPGIRGWLSVHVLV